MAGLPRRFSGKESACNAGDPGLIPGSGRSPGEGNGHPLQYPCLENPMDRGAWLVIVHGIAESDTTEVTLHTHTETDKKHFLFKRTKHNNYSMIASLMDIEREGVISYFQSGQAS